MGSLSGGERCRAALARLAAAEANFLVLDEPTNHLDLWARDALEKALGEFDGTVLLVSHDRYFVNRVADHLLVIEPERVRIIEGNYDTYQMRLSNREPSGQPAEDDAGRGGLRRRADRAKAAEGSKKPARQRRFPFRKVADLEDEIFERETCLHELQCELAEPERAPRRPAGPRNQGPNRRRAGGDQDPLRALGRGHGVELVTRVVSCQWSVVSRHVAQWPCGR